MTETPRQVRCPHCGTETPWCKDNVWRPFCSERCRMIDLGAWASEAYRVPAEGDPAGELPNATDSSA